MISGAWRAEHELLVEAADAAHRNARCVRFPGPSLVACGGNHHRQQPGDGLDAGRAARADRRLPARRSSECECYAAGDRCAAADGSLLVPGRVRRADRLRLRGRAVPWLPGRHGGRQLRGRADGGADQVRRPVLRRVHRRDLLVGPQSGLRRRLSRESHRDRVVLGDRLQLLSGVLLRARGVHHTEPVPGLPRDLRVAAAGGRAAMIATRKRVGLLVLAAGLLGCGGVTTGTGGTPGTGGTTSTGGTTGTGGTPGASATRRSNASAAAAASWRARTRRWLPACGTALAAVQAKCTGQPFVGFIGEICVQTNEIHLTAGCLAKLNAPDRARRSTAASARCATARAPRRRPRSRPVSRRARRRCPTEPRRFP